MMVNIIAPIAGLVSIAVGAAIPTVREIVRTKRRMRSPMVKCEIETYAQVLSIKDVFRLKWLAMSYSRSLVTRSFDKTWSFFSRFGLILTWRRHVVWAIYKDKLLAIVESRVL